MKRLTYLVATSADGYIARSGGSFDFALSEGEHFSDLIAEFPEMIPTHLREAFNVTAGNRRFDTILMGRATYEVAGGITNPYGHLKQYVFSRSLAHSPDPNVTLVQDNALECVRQLKKEDGKGLWLCGGAKLAAALFPEIDDLILKVNPVVIGSGIPIFAGDIQETRMRVAFQKTYANGFMLVHYKLRSYQ